MQNQNAAIKKLETQIGYLFKQLSNHNLCNNNNSSKEEECQAITLRSGKELKELSQKPQEEGSNEKGKEQDGVQTTASSPQKEKGMPKLNISRAPYPQQLKKKEDDNQFVKFLEIFKKLQINIPFIKAIQQIPAFIKYMKELLPRKSSLKGGQNIVLNKECSALIPPELPAKRKDQGSFHIPCAIGETLFDKALCDLGVSINLLLLSLVKRLQINEIMPTDVVIRLADKTQKQAIGVVENVLLKVGKYFLPTDFVILDMEESHTHPIILGRPFLATARALIDVEKGELILRIHDEWLSFNVFKLSQEADQEHKEPSKDHDEMLKEEESTEAHPTYLETPLVDKQGKQQLPQLKEKLEEPKPLEACEDNITNPLEKEVIKSKTISKDTRKKVPRKWRNKKIPTEDFSPGDRVISAYFPDIPPNLLTIPSQLPKVFTINRVLSLEHVEIIDTTNGYKSTARGEDFKHYQPP
ncbi:uncharacterized protein LOC130939715 [Arachis stenosperma]|uniref:uncharacterized protein LOC130939715 n=1 Tax=Arachis stenosperma TaxID=217475 RepID=UPI0025ABE98E|nr:uncharacterized protein LOC130939715 [Arachis stenosperma]